MDWMPMEGVEEDVEMTDADADGDDADGKTKADEDGSTKESNNPKSPEVGDVVDLSGGPNNNNGLSEKNKTPAGMYDTEFCGKLRLEFLIDGIPQDEVCHIDRVIHLAATAAISPARRCRKYRCCRSRAEESSCRPYNCTIRAAEICQRTLTKTSTSACRSSSYPAPMSRAFASKRKATSP